MSIIEGKAVKIRRPLLRKDMRKADKLENASPAKKKRKLFGSISDREIAPNDIWMGYISIKIQVSQTRRKKKQITTLLEQRGETPVKMHIL